MYLRNSNSGEQQQKSNGGVNGGERQRSSSSMLIDNQIIELEKHANSLHNLLAQEKEKVRFWAIYICIFLIILTMNFNYLESKTDESLK